MNACETHAVEFWATNTENSLHTVLVQNMTFGVSSLQTCHRSLSLFLSVLRVHVDVQKELNPQPDRFFTCCSCVFATSAGALDNSFRPPNRSAVLL